MNKIKPLISICIPTYNRAHYLEKSLNSIIVQEMVNWNEIEIVVSDNNSNDNTEIVIKKYFGLIPNFKYFKNYENINDKNFPLVLDRAEGSYRKLYNDTLIMKKGGLSHFVRIVKRNFESKPVLFFRNNKLWEKEKEFDNLETFLFDVSYFTTWIGGFGIWEEDLKSIKNLFQGCESQLWQEKTILETIVNKKKVIVDHYTFATVQSVTNKDMSYDLYRVFYKNYLSFLKEYVECRKISEECFKWLEKDLLYNFFSNHLINFELSYLPINYAKSEDKVIEAIYSTYRDKDYYEDFLMQFKKKLFFRKIKEVVKKCR